MTQVRTEETRVTKAELQPRRRNTMGMMHALGKERRDAERLFEMRQWKKSSRKWPQQHIVLANILVLTAFQHVVRCNKALAAIRSAKARTLENKAQNR
ncbi:hypothetical protein KXD40_000828 [Peronospora effusa]|uniref:Uncharacterized protein n=1 Tax=Peronospora effusa TaxID=542832 RepID=A0A3M6VKJ2_9STRA|nr:hypothetical protein DD238_006518 [Peronospora effusa]RQM10011.1 hypothetical protein DD237_006865 [Peronospora effusa]UIZ21244.1 hypothetical protein KXD40_000828 [Peronospora effusa]